ncbi:Mut7-C ubiquitin/RNAse domain-containing protein [Massilia agri]|uniref:Mut7-C ubiquitin/RNAse domain-containing protein n=1 Tax=Massilia agri TaxID=1886785 RepID=A0ABT2APT4_9BURK|nr:Mut7-C ubiquitin/RNAse domain-containing protein [Massilia agri]MCS0598252.1 Mut7-C ubiquitin/RNAse domain-containing protein [Massilia agri]
MVTATFRFYDQLNDFLPRERRGRAFTTPCAREATAKHMVEALGVPHTEVELLLVNGESSGFDRLLADGDRVAVYPAFGELDVHTLQRLRSWPAERLRFVADAHLGGLARLLRMAGFDTLYDNGYHDADIERIAREEGRVLLTRDRELLKRRTVELGCYLHALDPPEQLRELFSRLRLAGEVRAFTLCLHCNLPLRPVDKGEVLEQLPPRVRESHAEFTTCDACRRVYWKGSHYARMHDLLEGVTARAADVELPPTPQLDA